MLFNKYYAGDQIKKYEMGGACGTYGGEENCIYSRVWRRKPEDKRPLERPRRKWKDNIIMDIQEVGLESKD